MYYYKIYGLNILSQLEIPEAVVIENFEVPDVSIELGQPPKEVWEHIENGETDYLTSNLMWFYLSGLVLFYIENGNRILIYIESAKLTMQNIRSYLIGSAFSLLLMQRGYIVMHGSSLQYKEKGILITGCSGSGKSTLAVALREKGAKFISDDISALMVSENNVFVLPSIPQQKLCRNALSRFTIDNKNLTYIDEDRDKFAIKIENGYVETIHRLVSIFQLTIGTSLKIEELSIKDRIILIFSNLYRGEAYQRSNIWREKMRFFLTIASQTKIYRITRPKNVESLNQIIDIIENKI